MNDLVKLTRDINSSQDVIESLKGKTLSDAEQAMAEILLQGQRLLKLKTSLGHGQWLPYLGSHCKTISERTAQDYMRFAANPKRAADLMAAGSVHRALGLIRDQEKKEPKQWPAYIEANSRLGKLLDFIEKNPMASWPKESLDQFREQMARISSQLWPEKFQAN